MRSSLFLSWPHTVQNGPTCLVQCQLTGSRLEGCCLDVQNNSQVEVMDSMNSSIFGMRHRCQGLEECCGVHIISVCYHERRFFRGQSYDSGVNNRSTNICEPSHHTPQTFLSGKVGRPLFRKQITKYETYCKKSAPISTLIGSYILIPPTDTALTTIPLVLFTNAVFKPRYICSPPLWALDTYFLSSATVQPDATCLFHCSLSKGREVLPFCPRHFPL